MYIYELKLEFDSKGISCHFIGAKLLNFKQLNFWIIFMDHVEIVHVTALIHRNGEGFVPKNDARIVNRLSSNSMLTITSSVIML